MVFPQTALPIKVEFNLGGWTDVTSYVRGEQGINITRGRQNESAQAERTQATLTLENTDGRWSQRNPTGPYYDLLGLNTPCRISVPADATTLMLPGGESDYVSCPDAAALDITGDIDIRFDALAHDWVSAPLLLAAKWRVISPTVNRSWAFVVDGGFLKLWWSTGGTAATKTSATSTARIPVTTGRLAVRVVLDVNNGASGNTTTFYTSDTISGTWTQLGDPVVASGTTSIFSSSAPLEVGGWAENSNILEDIDAYGVYGQVYAFQLRSGIGGTVVANPTFTSQTPGATSFADTSSPTNTWTVTSNALITDRSYRFHGEISSWPQTWDGTRRNAVVNLTAAGVLRRITQGPSPLRSVLYRAFTSPSVIPPIVYWPCEDASGAASLASGLPDGQPMTFIGNFAPTPELASYSGFACSGPIPKVANSSWIGAVPGYTSTSTLQFHFLFSTPGWTATSIPSEVVRITMRNATIPAWAIYYDDSSGGTLKLYGLDAAGGVAVSGAPLTGVDGFDASITITLTQATGVDAKLSYYVVGTDVGVGSLMSTAGAATLGYATEIQVARYIFANPVTDAYIGHILLRTYAATLDTIVDPLVAYAGETSGARMNRLCSEEGIALRSIGDLADTEPMGAQKTVTLVDLIRECVDADAGMLFEPLDVLGLGYRTRKSLSSQSNAVLANYAAHELPASNVPIPTGDDDGVVNDITVTRTNGSSIRRTLTTGRKSTAAPPSGVGTYNSSISLNLHSESQLADQASFRLWQGTVDAERYPTIVLSRTTPAVVANASLNRQLLTAQVGHILAIDNPPFFVEPGQVRQMIQGWTERLSNFEHTFSFNCSPAAAWDFSLAELGNRVDTAGSQLASSANSTATSLILATTSGPRWTEQAADLPLDLKVSGEVVTATAMAPTISDSFTRTTSNGWGSATSGQAWTSANGSASDYSTNGSVGIIAVSATGVDRWMALAQTSPAWDVEFRSRTVVAALTQPINTYICLNMSTTASGYLARMAFYPDTSVRLSIEEFPSFGQIASEVTVPGLVHGANTWFRMRFEARGGVIRSRAWLDGTAEPDVWHCQTTDTRHTSGTMSLRAVLTSGNTNTLPVQVQYDDLKTYTPQTATVTRSVNGVSKSQASGAAVNVRYPAVLAL